MNKLALAGLSLVLPVVAAAATDATTFDTLVVTGSRTDTRALRLANTVTVIDRAAIQASQAASLAELLASRAGIEVLDFYGDGSRAGFGLRGFGENAASNTLVLIDGQPLNNPDIANPDLARIRLEDIERVEVLDGGSALWGDQAVGGVIHIVTRQAPATGVRFTRGAFDMLDLQARAATGGERWQLSLGGGERHSDNYRDHNALTRGHANLQARLGGALAEAWLRLDYSDEQLQTPGGLFADEIAADRRQSVADFANDFSALETLNLAGGLRADLGQHWQFDGRVARYDADGRFRLSFRGFAGEPASQQRAVNSFNPQWTWRYALAGQDGHLLLGADIQRADYLLNSQFGQQRNDQARDDYYASALVPVHRWADLSLGLRQSRIDNDIADPGPFAVLPDGQTFRHDETLASAGVTVRLGTRLALLAGWDEVLRYPKVDEYFGSGFTPDTISLRPQTGDNLQLGLRYAGAALSGSLVAYRLELDDEIVFDPASFANTNLDRTTRDGLSLNARWTAHPRLALALSASVVDAQIRGAGRIPLVAEQHGQLSIDVDAGRGWQLQAQVQAASDRPAGGDTDASAAPLPGYGVVNLAARWQRPGVSLGLKLVNALDREYAAVGFEDGFTGQVARFPLPGAHWRVSVAVDL